MNEPGSKYGKTALIAEVAKATSITQTQVAQVVNATQHAAQIGVELGWRRHKVEDHR
jgi:hypothetical protein